MADRNAYTQAINVALADAKGMLGKNEVPDRQEIQSYLRDGGQDLDPHKLAWCAAFVSASLQKAGLPVPTQVVKDSAFGPGAYAPNYLTYGSAVGPKDIQAGDILVSNTGSHVGFAEGPIRQGPNGPEVQLLAGNEQDPSGQYAPGSYTNPRTGAVANRSQVGMVGERWVPLSQYSARRYQPTDGQDASSPSASSAAPARPSQGTTINSVPTTVTASTPFSLSPPGSSIPSAGQFQPLINAAAQKYNLDPNFLARVLWQENRFRPEGTSPAGAQGIAQFIPSTAARYGVDVHDPASSIEGAAHYLSDLSSRYSGNLGLAAAGYNWGEGKVDKWLQGKASPPPETTNYVSTITGHSMDEWRADPRLPLGTGGPGRSPSGPSGAPTAPAGGLPAVAAGGTPGTTLPGFTPGSAGAKMTQAGLKTLGFGDDKAPAEPPPIPQLGPPPMAMGGPMMMQAGGMNVQPRIQALQDLAQRGFPTGPSMAEYTMGGARVPAGLTPIGMATGMPSLPGTTLNSPSQLQMALMSGNFSPYDMYAGLQGGGGYGST